MSAKHTYWMDKATFKDVRSELDARGLKLAEARKAVCLPLSRKISQGFVPPEAWSKFDLCRRQLSWYRTSRFAGQFLVITDIPLADYGIDMVPETIIEKIKFKPGDLPGKDPEKMDALYETREFHDQCPDEFLDIGSMEADAQEKWLKIMGIRGITYPALFREQCANHANFITPTYYLEKNGFVIPYSIGKTNRVCSACLQFFNIVGEEFVTKYVVPCPGAALFAGMAVNKYYQVRSGLKYDQESVAG